jgi:segregation and condensation protein A
MGLLLFLIRKEEMDIFDLNVAEITKQYLDYIRLMKELDLEVAGDFVAMAATLIHIKSRMLLPQYDEQGEIIEQDDPRKELVQKLIEYQRYQEAAKQLYGRPLLNRDVWSSKLSFEDADEAELGEIITEDDGLFSLISSYRKALKRMNRAVHQVREKVQSIASRIMDMKHRLIVGTRVTMRELVTAQPGEQRAQILITFLSLLELGRMGFVKLFQSETYGDIHIETRKELEGNVLERVQEFESEDTESVINNLINAQEEERLILAEDDPFFEKEDSPQMGLGEQKPADAPADVPTEDIATDEDIFAAEIEIGEAASSDSEEPWPVPNTDLVSNDAAPAVELENKTENDDREPEAEV